jgi:hypothetical protein
MKISRRQIACDENANFDIASNNSERRCQNEPTTVPHSFTWRSEPLSRNCALQVRNFDEQEAALRPMRFLSAFIASTIDGSPEMVLGGTRQR